MPRYLIAMARSRALYYDEPIEKRKSEQINQRNNVKIDFLYAFYTLKNPNVISINYTIVKTPGIEKFHIKSALFLVVLTVWSVLSPHRFLIGS